MYVRDAMRPARCVPRATFHGERDQLDNPPKVNRFGALAHPGGERRRHRDAADRARSPGGRYIGELRSSVKWLVRCLARLLAEFVYACHLPYMYRRPRSADVARRPRERKDASGETVVGGWRLG